MIPPPDRRSPQVAAAAAFSSPLSSSTGAPTPPPRPALGPPWPEYETAVEVGARAAAARDLGRTSASRTSGKPWQAAAATAAAVASRRRGGVGMGWTGAGASYQ